MINKKQVTGLVAIALLGGAFVTPVYAATTEQNTWGAGQPGAHMGKRTPTVRGSVTAITGATLTVADSRTGTVYTVDATTATVVKGYVASTLSAITVGDNVVVEGTVNGTSITATKILDNKMQRRGDREGMMTKASSTRSGVQGSGEPVVMGKVTTLSGSLITITNNGKVTYTIDATNAKIVKAGVSGATIANIAVGDVVTAQGLTNGASVVATSVLDQTLAASSNAAAAAGSGVQMHRGFFGSLEHFFSSLFGF